MYTSDTDGTEKSAAKISFVYLLISIFCALFGAVYELFSHGVYSFSMIYAFAFPLIGGALVFRLPVLTSARKYPSVAAQNPYHCGIATLTVGSIVHGVLEIYGTMNALVRYYWIVGGVLILCGIIIYFIQTNFKKTLEISPKV